ncbi:transmembrane protein, putative [Medicago truncatula]|uniref:Transmembrane protein, putative n=1 Tax=Medicago truncatula TaxID=3880 RepID=G7LDD1_MEDTR|nr:transmembrane protein, putative [Medicago truncatula]
MGSEDFSFYQEALPGYSFSSKWKMSLLNIFTFWPLYFICVNYLVFIVQIMILKWLGKDFGIKILDKVRLKIDHQKSKKHLIFEDRVRKNKAAKARLLRKNVLQVKKTRRLKTMSKENAPISSALPNKPSIYTAVNSKVNQEIEESNVTSPKVSEIQISTPPPSNQAMQESIHNRKKWIND